MSVIDELRNFGRTMAESAEAWQANVRAIAADREARAAQIEAECGGRETVHTAWMKLFAEIGWALGGGRRG